MTAVTIEGWNLWIDSEGFVRLHWTADDASLQDSTPLVDLCIPATIYETRATAVSKTGKSYALGAHVSMTDEEVAAEVLEKQTLIRRRHP